MADQSNSWCSAKVALKAHHVESRLFSSRDEIHEGSQGEFGVAVCPCPCLKPWQWVQICLLTEKLASVFSCFLGGCSRCLECGVSRNTPVLGKLRAALETSWHARNAKHSRCLNSLKLSLMNTFFTCMFAYSRVSPWSLCLWEKKES